MWRARAARASARSSQPRQKYASNAFGQTYGASAAPRAPVLPLAAHTSRTLGERDMWGAWDARGAAEGAAGGCCLPARPWRGSPQLQLESWRQAAKQVCGKGRIGSAASTPLEAAARALRKQRRARSAASVCIRRAQQGVRGAACPRGAAKRPGGQFPPTSTQKIKASLRLAPLGGELCERTRYLSVATL